MDIFIHNIKKTAYRQRQTFITYRQAIEIEGCSVTDGVSVRLIIPDLIETRKSE